MFTRITSWPVGPGYLNEWPLGPEELAPFKTPPRPGEPSPVRAEILWQDDFRRRSLKNPRAYAAGLASKTKTKTISVLGFLPISMAPLP